MGNILVVDRESGDVIKEQVPFKVKFQLWFLFQTWPGRLLLLTPFLRGYLVNSSKLLGPKCDHPDSRASIPGFIASYGVDMKEVAVPIESFGSMNEFFYRELKAGCRPVFEPDHAAAAVQPADARVVVFESAGAATRMWIKGRHFTMQRFLGTHAGGDAETLAQFCNGSLVISRLAPTDYHRFHSPVAGKVVRVARGGADLFTVKPAGVRSPVDVLGLNQRTCISIDTVDFGLVLYIAVGATYVGSINLQVKEGHMLEKGDEVGYFAYGGSCVVTVFRENTIQFDEDLMLNSSRDIETLVKHGTSLGLATPQKMATDSI